MEDKEIQEAAFDKAERALGWKPTRDEDDPRYDQYWMHASVFLMKALCRAADKLVRLILVVDTPFGGV